MAYKDADRQREASKERMRRYRERKGVTEQGVTPVSDVTPFDLSTIPAPGTLTTMKIAAYVCNLSAGQAQAILNGWADGGNGTPYQRDLALLGRKYQYGGAQKGHNPPSGRGMQSALPTPNYI